MTINCLSIFILLIATGCTYVDKRIAVNCKECDQCKITIDGEWISETPISDIKPDTTLDCWGWRSRWNERS
jgi:hypothetical protein